MIYSLNKPLKAHQKTIPIRRFKWPIRGFNFHRIAKIYFTEHLKELRITFVQNRNICTRQPTTMAKNENCGMLLALSVPLVCIYSINLSFEKFIMQLVNHGNYTGYQIVSIRSTKATLFQPGWKVHSFIFLDPFSHLILVESHEACCQIPQDFWSSLAIILGLKLCVAHWLRVCVVGGARHSPSLSQKHCVLILASPCGLE